MAVLVSYQLTRDGSLLTVQVDYWQDSAATSPLVSRDFRYSLLEGSIDVARIQADLADFAQRVDDAVARWLAISAVLGPFEGQRLTQAQVRRT